MREKIRSSTTNNNRDRNKLGSASSSGGSANGGFYGRTDTNIRDKLSLESVDLGCATRTGGPLVFNSGTQEMTGPQIYVSIPFGSDPVFAMGMERVAPAPVDEQDNNGDAKTIPEMQSFEETSSSSSSSTTVTKSLLPKSATTTGTA